LLCITSSTNEPCVPDPIFIQYIINGYSDRVKHRCSKWTSCQPACPYLACPTGATAGPRCSAAARTAPARSTHETNRACHSSTDVSVGARSRASRMSSKTQRSTRTNMVVHNKVRDSRSAGLRMQKFAPSGRSRWRCTQAVAAPLSPRVFVSRPSALMATRPGIWATPLLGYS
jgi:hypothetical protein